MHSFCGKVNSHGARARGIEAHGLRCCSIFCPLQKKKKDQKSNFVISVEMADECVVAGEPPHCRQSMVARLKLKGIDGRAPPGVEPAA